MADTKDTPLEQLKAFLNKLFQFESQDLDFGVYRILHYKRREIKQFLDELLTNKVKEQLQTLSDAQAKSITEQIQEYEKDKIIQKWMDGPEAVKTVLEGIDQDKITAYKEIKAQALASEVLEETENQIYNHLALFFSRYYDKGDFISKRRYGKNEKYVVPYNGEETHFHWANHDQYYIKSSETFQQFAFKIQHGTGDLTVNFKLTEVTTEQGNVKADENKYFVLAEKEPELNGEELTIFFEYRPLSENEKKTVTGNNKQDTLDEQTAGLLFEKLKKHPITAGLCAKKEDKTILLRQLQKYTRKNKYDFFIHKNLKGFLQRELDFYIKSELVNVDDLYVSETDFYFETVKQNFKKIKVFKSIADTLIDLLAQIEDFQKKLWEKKKFVLSTEWVITIDRLVEYAGDEAAIPLLKELLQNKAQHAEWINLFGKENVADGKLSINSLKSGKGWKKLPIDTVHFPKTFKEKLLSILSMKISIDAFCDGILIESDNYHLLNILKEKFNKRIDCAYFDPPFNTGGSQFIYKNTFQHSSWASMMVNRLNLTKDLLSEKGVNILAIDDFELFNLAQIGDRVYGKEKFIGNLVVEIKPSGRTNDDFLATSHEYNLFYAQTPSLTGIKFTELTEKQKAEYKYEDKISKYKWRDFLRTGGYSTPKERPNSFYPIYYNETTKNISLEVNKESIEILPVDSMGNFRVWRKTPASFKKHLLAGDIQIIKKEDRIKIEIKDRIKDGKRPKSVWVGAQYDASSHGTKHIKKLFSNPKFSYPKSINSVVEVISLVSFDESIVLDIFGGSGTTAEAVLRKNQGDNSMKFILGEQNTYFYNTIIPRIKKIAYTFDWKDGKPKASSMNGLGVFFKYQRLEQYEEALENIAFSTSDETIQQAMQFERYIAKYFLNFETRESQTLVNTEAMLNPWNYNLKVWNGFTYDTEQAADLVETFNYLIGLHLQKCITKTIEGRKYQFVSGSNNAGKRLLIVWRSTENWETADYATDRKILKAELADFSYDLLYISGQAHLEDYYPVEEIFKNKMLP